jgi:hypothetical protein
VAFERRVGRRHGLRLAHNLIARRVTEAVWQFPEEIRLRRWCEGQA